jgi:hypothetical protein
MLQQNISFKESPAESPSNVANLKDWNVLVDS